MPPKVDFPSPELLRDLVKMRDEWLRGKTATTVSVKRPGLATGASTYVVKVPTSGIPALNQTTNKPGSALCDVYKIAEDTTGTSGSAELVPIDTSRRVYNISLSAITARYVLATRIKAGEIDGFVVDSPGRAEDTGTGTGTGDSCVDILDGHTLVDLPTGTPQYVLGIDSNGCLIRVAVGTC